MILCDAVAAFLPKHARIRERLLELTGDGCEEIHIASFKLQGEGTGRSGTKALVEERSHSRTD